MTDLEASRTTSMNTLTALEVAALAMHERSWTLRRAFNPRKIAHARVQVAQAIDARPGPDAPVALDRQTATIVGHALTAQSLYAQPDAQKTALGAGETLFPTHVADGPMIRQNWPVPKNLHLSFAGRYFGHNQ